MNKHFLNIICNKAWSSFELLTKVSHRTRERKDERGKRSSMLQSPGWLGEGLGIEGK